MTTATRADRRRAFREHQVDLLPKPTKGSCARPSCERNYRVQNYNKFRVCPSCLDVVQTIEWLLTTGVLTAGGQKSPLEALGLIQPR